MAESEGIQESRWNFSQNFLNEFQSSRSDLETSIEQATQSAPISRSVLDSLNLQLAKLSKSLVDATGSIPNFDQRNCEAQLHQLEKTLESLRKASSTTSKFAFKRKAKEAPNLPLPTPAAATTNSVAASSLPATLTLSSFSGKLVTPSDLPDPEAVASELRSELSITDLDTCILNLIGSKQHDISALHIRNVKNSILLLPALEGSVILHDLLNCIVVVKCHQFRMHNSKETDVYIFIQSNPTIEHCSSIRFGPYPSILSSTDIQQNPDDLLVQDFSHIKSTPSPNWSLIAEVNRKSPEDWQSIINRGSVDVEQVLQVLPAYAS